MNLLLLHYNNYINRVIKKLSTVAEYKAADANYIDIPKFNFNPNDGVTTSAVVGVGTLSKFENGGPDYVVIYDDTNAIQNRWFIMGISRTRSGQYQLSLKRDCISDFYESVIKANCIIERAMIPSTNNLIFNKENFSYNQIRQEPQHLKDRSGIQWVVGYIARDANYRDGEGNVLPIPLDLDALDDPNIPKISGLIAAGEYNEYPTISAFNINWYNGVSSGSSDTKWLYKTKFNDDYQETIAESQSLSVYGLAHVYTNNTNNVGWDIQELFDGSYFSLYTSGAAYVYSQINSLTAAQTAKLNQIRGRIFYDTATNKFYKCNVTSEYRTGLIQNVATDSSIFTTFDDAIKDSGIFISGRNRINAASVQLEYSTRKVNISYEEVATPTGSITLSDLRSHCTEGLYDIFAIPYGELDVYSHSTLNPTPSKIFTTSDLDARNAAINIAQRLTTSGCYDVQLLPYCPTQNLIKLIGGKYVLDIDAADEGKFYDFMVNSGNQDYGIVLWISEPSFTFNIDKELKVFNDPSLERSVCYKIDSETNFYRLSSPNYQSSFEFCAAKNDGVDTFNVDVTLKPFNPYIHINPNFKRMYGGDYDTSIGLVLQGDFSFGRISDRWDEYQLQNKNYENVFNRQIQSMEVEHEIQKQESIFAAIAGTVGGAATGASPGAYGGSAVGAAIGAAASGVASAVGGILDYSNLIKRQAEQKDLSIDMHEFQLDNIKALPYTLTKCPPFNANYQKFPFIEEYKATEEEVDALKEYIRLRSFNIGVIGKVEDYIQDYQSFIKAQIIRIDELNANASIASDIYEELNKGVYL